MSASCASNRPLSFLHSFLMPAWFNFRSQQGFRCTVLSKAVASFGQHQHPPTAAFSPCIFSKSLPIPSEWSHTPSEWSPRDLSLPTSSSRSWMCEAILVRLDTGRHLNKYFALCCRGLGADAPNLHVVLLTPVESAHLQLFGNHISLCTSNPMCSDILTQHLVLKGWTPITLFVAVERIKLPQGRQWHLGPRCATVILHNNCTW